MTGQDPRHWPRRSRRGSFRRGLKRVWIQRRTGHRRARGAAHERNCCEQADCAAGPPAGCGECAPTMRPSSRVMTAAELRSRLPQLRDTCQAAVVRQGRRTQEDRSLTAAGTCQIGGVRRKIRVVAVYAAIAIAALRVLDQRQLPRPRLLPRRVPVLQPSRANRHPLRHRRPAPRRAVSNQIRSPP